MAGRKINIIDVTVRDGSYAVAFKFTAGNVKDIVKKLQKIGVEWVEIGHGVGFGAGKAGMPCETSDEEQIKAARAALKGAKKPLKLGVIGSPPIFRLEDLKLVAKQLDFVRLACNVVFPETLKYLIPACKKMGLKVFAQIMRSTSIAPKSVSVAAKKLAEYGADVIYVVDTAGCLVPSLVPEYIGYAKEASKRPVGFHAHNNLGLAVANTLAAIESGADFVDASLHGVGRGSGNVPLEILALLLKKAGYKCPFNERVLLDAADEIYLKLLQYFPDAPASEAYLAYKERDFFPFTLLEIIAKEIKVPMYDIIDQLAKFPAGRDITLDQVGDILAKLGHDENDVFKRIGLLPPI
ncbi:MAG: 4-hydroxy-2-oxovalerate aldolase [Deltaproteobacteria bacterium CG_4_10_14_0_2_um_filter_43_8]|nr:MAG: 4-hydroxy-2-oxovalerate aldolase [Deltaproteobacteria bacterium CG11_big_fil_rev_8_21_14_0_20_49_13]PJA20707.1 MAG: 4-hydroxy-2-oxovalerate aldolase [Deltaproteobacteria bacterium CG_4_10_14_0_2_um_filter_43_8]